MGCTTSSLDRLPAVSLCYQRCKFLDEALRRSYSLFNAHLAYMHSLKSLGPTLRNFLHQNVVDQSKSMCESTHNTDVIEPKYNASKSSSTTDSEYIIRDLHSDSEGEEEFIRDGKFDLLHNINPNYFRERTVSSNQFDNSYFAQSSPESSARAWRTPPPPAPSSSTWDFLNLFESYERYDLLKLDKKGTDDAKSDKSGENREKLVTEEGNVKKKKKGDSVKSVDDVSAKMQGKEKNELYNRSVTEILREIEVMFQKASESGIEVQNLLNCGADYGEGEDFDGDVSKNSGNVFSTIKKMCIWEKKLYDEVKAEEKLRIVRARYCRQMKSFDEKGVKTNKVESTRALIRTISTKINVSIQVIDRISLSISKLRDEELWPQMIEFILKFLEMWKSMTECHQCQSQAVVEARNLDFITSNIKHDDAYLESAMQLKIEFQKWHLSFCKWIDSQRGFAKALKNWLLKCLSQEPGGTPDGLSPNSPGRMSTPPLFALCNQWSHAMNNISEMEVIENFNGVLVNLNQTLEHEYISIQQRVFGDKDAEKRIKILEREEQKMQKLLVARGKKAFLSNKDAGAFFLPSGAVHGSVRTPTTALHLCLKQTFIAIHRFSAKNMEAYEQLHVYIEEARRAKENAPGP